MLGKRIELERLMRCPVTWDAETQIENWDWSILHLDWLHCLHVRLPEGSDIPVLPQEYDDLYSSGVQHIVAINEHDTQVSITGS